MKLSLLKGTRIKIKRNTHREKKYKNTKDKQTNPWEMYAVVVGWWYEGWWKQTKKKKIIIPRTTTTNKPTLPFHHSDGTVSSHGHVGIRQMWCILSGDGKLYHHFEHSTYCFTSDP